MSYYSTAMHRLNCTHSTEHNQQRSRHDAAITADCRAYNILYLLPTDGIIAQLEMRLRPNYRSNGTNSNRSNQVYFAEA